MKPIIGITMGDPAGIGPEILVKSLSEKDLYQSIRPLVIGDPEVIRQALKMTGHDFKILKVVSPSEGRYEFGLLDVLEVNPITPGDLIFGQVKPAFGQAAVKQSLEAARLALCGKIDAVVSAPVNKEAMRAAGYHYEGQTQLFGEASGVDKWAMLLIFGNIRCTMLSTHLSLLDAVARITPERIMEYLRLMDESMWMFTSDRKPVIAVSALNPHAGESGLFGREEIERIKPAIDEANRALNSNIVGPIPSDTIFVRARDGEFDAILTLYHDQANMAMKLIGFGQVVTYLLGLPIIRCSVGHGTAFDIAGKSSANHENLKRAIETAAEMSIARIRRNEKHDR